MQTSMLQKCGIRKRRHRVFCLRTALACGAIALVTFCLLPFRGEAMLRGNDGGGSQQVGDGGDDKNAASADATSTASASGSVSDQSDGGSGDSSDPCVKISVSSSSQNGEIIAQLFPKDAPATVENFKKYVDDKYYDGTIWHRVIPGFMIQGGGFTPSLYQNDFQEKPGQRPPIKNEAKLDNQVGTLSMARTSDPDSATSQFFINVADNVSLNPSPGNAGYAVFGKVISGMDVANSIVSTPTTSVGSFDDVPTEAISIQSITHVQCPPADA